MNSGFEGSPLCEIRLMDRESGVTGIRLRASAFWFVLPGRYLISKLN